MEVSYSVSSIFESIWGYSPANFDISTQPLTTTGAINYFGDKTSLYGTSYFLPVKLGGVELMHPIIRITSKKTIVETALVNRTGSVKELISTDDYKINIKGIIIRDDHVFPEAEIRSLREIYLKDEALPIDNALVSLFLQENENVVITDLTMPETKGGVYNVRAYEMNLVSDKSFKLIKS
jgi:hypothetical protein